MRRVLTRRTLRGVSPWAAWLLLALVLLALPAAAEDDDEDENDDGRFEELGKGSGSAATWFVAAGFIYVGLRQRAVRGWLLAQGMARMAYGRWLVRSLRLHYVVMALATLLALAHGVALAADKGLWEGASLTGLLPLLLMVYLSVAGLILWLRLPPEWMSRQTRRTVRLHHVQRWVTIVLVVTLALHLVGD